MNDETVIVVIEDDPNIADLLDMYLREAGHRVFLCPDGERGLDTIALRHPQLVIVDAGLPGIDGLEVCRRIRSNDNPVAIMMLTARDAEIDRVLGLEMGADDYVTKPFSPREVVARVKAILRRTSQPPAPHVAASPQYTLGPLSIDTARREARLNGNVVQLATREYDLLVFLVESKGLALSRRQLLDNVWGDNWYGDERTVDVHVRQLRKKLGASFNLATVWGVGYRLDDPQ